MERRRVTLRAASLLSTLSVPEKLTPECSVTVPATRNVVARMCRYARAVEIVEPTIAATRIRSPLTAMPFKYTIYPDRNLIRQQLWGRISAEDLRQLASDMWADPLYRKKLDILADLRQAEVDIPYNEMMEYTRFLGGNSHIGRQAIVVGRQLEFGMARMYEQLTESNVQRESLKVFFDIDDAERWLQLSEGTDLS